MIIHYEDIILRAIEYEDLDLLKEMINDPVIENMTGGGGLPVSKFQQEQWFKENSNRNDVVRLVIDVEEYGAIGIVMLTDIDWKNRTAQSHSKISTSSNLRNKGYGTKARKALIEYAFKYLNLNCIYSETLEYNQASQRVCEKCGFKKEGILRNRVYKNGKYHNIIMWSILKDEYLM